MFSFFSSKHGAKIVLGAPIMFMFFLGSSGVDQETNSLSFGYAIPEIIPIGEPIFLDVIISTTQSANAMAGSITYEPSEISVNEISLKDSVIDIWTQQPDPQEQEGKLFFSGGIADEKGLIGREKIFSFSFTPKQTGKLTLYLSDMQILASDGVGTDITSRDSSVQRKIFVYGNGQQSPDLNGDKKISLSDANILYINLLRTYNPRYDLNNDKKTNWGDVRFLLSLMSD